MMNFWVNVLDTILTEAGLLPQGGDVLLDFGLRILRNNPNVETSRPSDARHAGREGWFLSQFAGALV